MATGGRLLAVGTSLIKMDVQGAELDAIEGMRRTLTTHRPIVLCEMHGLNAAFAACLEGVGYRVRTLDGQSLRDAPRDAHALATPIP